MIEAKDINWKKLHVESLDWFKPYVHSEERQQHLAKILMNGHLNLSDEFRHYPIIHHLIYWYFNAPALHLFYEIGDFQGLLGFVNIIPSHKAELLMKMWDKDIWKPSIVKEARKLIQLVMDEFQLIRLSAETADLKVVKMAKMIGFNADGIKEKDFKYNDKLFDTYVLTIVRED